MNSKELKKEIVDEKTGISYTNVSFLLKNRIKSRCYELNRNSIVKIFLFCNRSF